MGQKKNPAELYCLHARRWYYDGIEKDTIYSVKGERLYQLGIKTFQFQLLTFAMSVFNNILLIHHGVAIAKVASVPLIVLPIYFVILLQQAGAITHLY